VGQEVFWTVWEWDIYYCEQSESGTVIIVDRVRFGQL